MNSTPGKICSLCKETKSLDSFGKINYRRMAKITTVSLAQKI